MWICRDQDNPAAGFKLTQYVCSSWACRPMSVLDQFVRMRLYRERASEFELLADAEVSPNVQSRHRIIARLPISAKRRSSDSLMVRRWSLWHGPTVWTQRRSGGCNNRPERGSKR
jgi:hypothetical protein